VKRNYTTFCILILFITQSGCVKRYHNNLNSVLWLQTSAEYQLITSQTYKLANSAIDKALSDKNWSAFPPQKARGKYSGLDPAIIMDIDETILDNSPFNAQLILDNKNFNSSVMDAWVSLSNATAISGAVQFVTEAKEKGVKIFYITNRMCKKRESGISPCPQKKDTLQNMNNVGFPKVTDSGELLLRYEQPSWNDDKESRRKFVAKNHRIILMVGDDLGDFIKDVKHYNTPERRSLIVGKYESYWGEKWFILPNPAYGSWLKILSQPREQYLRGFN